MCTDDCADESLIEEFWQNNYILMIALTASEYDENEYKNSPVKSKPLLYADVLRRPKEPQSNVKSFIM